MNSQNPWAIAVTICEPSKPPLAWPPASHQLIHPIARWGHRVFVAEFVRRTIAGHRFEAAVLGAMRTAFPKSRKRVSDVTARKRGTQHHGRYRSIIESLLIESSNREPS